MSDSLEKLAKLLGMMGSAHDGEVANAARLAERHRKEIGKTWGELLTGATSGSSKNADFEYMMRALRAEDENFKLRQRLRELEAEQRRRADDPTYRPRRAGEPVEFNGYILGKDKEDELVSYLLKMTCSTALLRSVTGWPRAPFRLILPELARQRGYTCERPSKGYYRFR